VIATEPEVSAMYLEASAMVLLELHRALEADRRREIRIAERRTAMLAASTPAVAPSDGIAGVAIGDGAGRRGDASADIGRGQDLDPAAGSQQGQRRLIRPVQSHPKS
jgi:hypothetical protein